MGIHDPCRQLDQLADISHKQDPLHTIADRQINGFSYIIAALHTAIHVKLQIFTDIPPAIISGGKQKVLFSGCSPLSDLRLNGIHNRFFTHRLQYPCRSKNRQASDDPQLSVKGPLCQFLTTRYPHSDQHPF